MCLHPARGYCRQELIGVVAAVAADAVDADAVAADVVVDVDDVVDPDVLETGGTMSARNRSKEIRDVPHGVTEERRSPAQKTHKGKNLFTLVWTNFI